MTKREQEKGPPYLRSATTYPLHPYPTPERRKTPHPHPCLPDIAAYAYPIHMSKSLFEQIKELPPADQDAMLVAWAEKAGMTLNQLAESLLTDWAFHGRPEQQVPPGHWKWWVVMTGRRWGKTRTAAEWIHNRIEKMPRTAGSTGGLLQRTSADLRDIMIEGPSGLLATAKPGRPVKFEPSKRQVLFHNGYIMKCYTAEEPDMLRGPTLSTGWADEFASLRAVAGIDSMTAFDNFQVALSAPVPGDRPRGIITTTPRRVAAVRKVLADSALLPKQYHVTNGTLMDNISNLDATTVHDLISKYAGTALGAQELDGILTTDVEGASFKSAVFEATRIATLEDCPEFGRVVIAVDPSTGDGTADECGISVVAISAAPIPTAFQHKGLTIIRSVQHLYILEDASIAGPPDTWARRINEKADEYETHLVVAEGNQGGEMVKTTIRSANPALRVKIVHARVGKNARAEPVAALFAQGRAHIIGEQPEMEDQATTFVNGSKDSPDRSDAMVWGCTFLAPAATRQTSSQPTDPALLARSLGEISPAERKMPSFISSPDSIADVLSTRVG